MDRDRRDGHPDNVDDGGEDPDDDQRESEYDGEVEETTVSDRGAASDTPPTQAERLNSGPGSRFPSLPPRPMDPSSLRQVLDCPLCRRPLTAPVTLHCAHTLCAHHLTSRTSCPLPRCAPPTIPPPNIPSESTVTYYPPSGDDTAPVPLPPSSASDFTINNILDLIDRIQVQLDRVYPLTVKYDSDLDDDDTSHPATSTSLRSRPRSSSGGSVERPRKRRRRLPPQESDDDPDGDLLSHLRAQSVRQRSTRHDQPLLPPSPPPAAPSRETTLANFEKELLGELTCEICLTLLYEPITTVCQHASLPEAAPQRLIDF